MRDQTPYLYYALKAVLRPKALLFWAALFYVLSVINGLPEVAARGGAAALLALAVFLSMRKRVAFK